MKLIIIKKNNFSEKTKRTWTYTLYLKSKVVILSYLKKNAKIS